MEVNNQLCRVKLIVEDWKQEGSNESIYNTELGVRLSLGDLHSGSTFTGEIELPVDALEDLKDAARLRAYPVFRLEIKNT